MDERTRAVTALLVFASESLVTSAVNFLKAAMTAPVRALCLDASTVVFKWLIPVVIVLGVERRGARSLGFDVPVERRGPYALFGAACILGPALILGFDNLFWDLAEQLLFIGLAEELFYRGYLMSRLCEWRGRTWGLIISAVVFSSAHIVFIVTNEGLGHAGFLASVAAQTFLGGLLLGYVFMREGNIVPGSIIHIAMNLYMSKVYG